MGGGTTAVEALVAGRKFIGSDINSLANFVSAVKTTVLDDVQSDGIREWVQRLPSLINLRRANSAPIDERTTHVPWNLRKLLSQALATCDVLDTQEAVNFARCTLLRTSQWALDCKRYIPNKEDFLRQHAEHAAKMLSGAEEFSQRVRTSHKTASIKDQMVLYTCSAAEMGTKALPLTFRKPKLLITSPPYPGVHMLYHRWQVEGRRESPAPYWLANCQDGQGASFYTFGSRQARTWDYYMEQVRSSFGGIRKTLHKNAHVVQLVAFSTPETQLPLYLRAMQEAGYTEAACPGMENLEGRLIRQVPNRKWYAQYKGSLSASKEFVFVHRPR